MSIFSRLEIFKWLRLIVAMTVVWIFIMSMAFIFIGPVVSWLMHDTPIVFPKYELIRRLIIVSTGLGFLFGTGLWIIGKQK